MNVIDIWDCATFDAELLDQLESEADLVLLSRDRSTGSINPPAEEPAELSLNFGDGLAGQAAAVMG
jgi:hypothetical protein